METTTQRVSFETARLALAHLRFDSERERDVVLQRAAQICSSTLGVERVGVWLLEGSQLVCPHLFVRSEGTCRAGEVIELDAVPAYRDALLTRKVIVADDAQHAPATRGLADFYLRPLGITSMLDAPVFHDGVVVGVVCLEHVGTPRVWSDAESTFSSSLADMLGMLLEQTARRAAEVALRDRIADEADHHRHALIGQIAAGVAHDFANVMQGIALAVAALPHATEVEAAGLRTDLLSWTNIGVGMVQQLRSFSTAARRGDRCDASAVLVELRAMLVLLCRGTADLSLDVAPEPAWAAISRTDLERVVFNLVLNARDAIAGSGHISLSLRSAADNLVVEVADTGEGISQELLEQVFQPYFTTKVQGTGLGLATVRTIVERACGSITLASTPGQGSCFTVMLGRLEPPVTAGS